MTTSFSPGAVLQYRALEKLDREAYGFEETSSHCESARTTTWGILPRHTIDADQVNVVSREVTLSEAGRQEDALSVEVLWPYPGETGDQRVFLTCHCGDDGDVSRCNGSRKCTNDESQGGSAATNDHADAVRTQSAVELAQLHRLYDGWRYRACDIANVQMNLSDQEGDLVFTCLWRLGMSCPIQR